MQIRLYILFELSVSLLIRTRVFINEFEDDFAVAI